ncbi:MAG: glutathione S-transferase family protein [Rhizobiaceae bacterium]
MPRLLVSNASPYSAKARMAATHVGIAFDIVATDTNALPSELIGSNPLGKIPVWITDDGDAVFDSRVITQHLNRLSGGALFPRNAPKRLEAERMEALADGICDALLAHIYERRFRPEEKVSQEWLEKQWAKATRSLDWLVANPPKLPARIHAGHIALRAMLGYLDLRFPGKWEKGRTRLKRWAKRFDEKFPALAAHAPH